MIELLLMILAIFFFAYANYLIASIVLFFLVAFLNIRLLGGFKKYGNDGQGTKRTN